MFTAVEWLNGNKAIKKMVARIKTRFLLILDLLDAVDKGAVGYAGASLVRLPSPAEAAYFMLVNI